VDAVAIDTVIEASSDCSDRQASEALLSASLAVARGPRRLKDSDARWQLRMRITAAAPGIKSADAEIRDDRGGLVAERSVSDRTVGSCVALVRAVGAWAQIVLDDELVRAHDEVERDERATSLPPLETRSIKSTPLVDRPVDADQPSSGEPRPPARGTFEVGTMLFLRNGAAATGGIFGVSPFLTISIASSWVLRPSLMYGTSTSRVPADQSNSENFSSLGGRLDACRRMPGNYIDHRGIEFDACIGGDVASVWSARDSATRGSIGPSAVLRGELGHDFGLEIRSLLGVSLNRARFMGGPELPPFVAGVELGASARFR
jgi:muconolactone delta-isomerase